jgi:hypothetical protein
MAVEIVFEVPIVLVMIAGLAVAIVLLPRSRVAALLLGAGCLVALGQFILTEVWSRVEPGIAETLHLDLSQTFGLVFGATLVLNVVWAVALGLALAAVFAGRVPPQR